MLKSILKPLSCHKFSTTLHLQSLLQQWFSIISPLFSHYSGHHLLSVAGHTSGNLVSSQLRWSKLLHHVNHHVLLTSTFSYTVLTTFRFVAVFASRKQLDLLVLNVTKLGERFDFLVKIVDRHRCHHWTLNIALKRYKMITIIMSFVAVLTILNSDAYSSSYALLKFYHF